MAKDCLLIADMIVDFIDPSGALYCGPAAEQIIPRVRELLDEFRAAQSPVVYLVDSHDPDDREFRLYGRHAVAGSSGTRIIAPLMPLAAEPIVAKKFFSGMHATALPDILARLSPAKVHLTGVCTSICIMETAGDLVEADYSVVVHADAVADFDEEMHACALERMRKVLRAEVVTQAPAEVAH
jgi:nicotinamidase/pyrazinamidase